MKRDRTLEYYEDNAEGYAAATVDVDTSELRAKFTEFLPAGGAILDAGCGSGRDAAAFIGLEFKVTAIEPARNLAAIAARNTGLDVEVRRFQEIDWNNKFDGIWCCASLLHVPEEDMPGVIARLARALRPGGILYASFKIADGSYQEQARRFTVVNTHQWQALIETYGLTLKEAWTTKDQNNRDGVEWINYLSVRSTLNPPK